MSESASWAEFRPLIKCLDPERHEDRTKLGIPDVDHVAGWVELKFIKEWPKRPHTPVRIDHYTPDQKGWATRRCYAAKQLGLRPNVYFLLHVGSTDEWLLMRGDIAAATVGRATRKQLTTLSAVYSSGLPNKAAVLDVLAPGVPWALDS